MECCQQKFEGINCPGTIFCNHGIFTIVASYQFYGCIVTAQSPEYQKNTSQSEAVQLLYVHNS